jgi:hypothetical protein
MLMLRSLFINMPTMAFLLLLYLSDNRLNAAFAGMLLAWAVLVFGQRQPAVVRGLNLHFALIVPLLFLFWHFGSETIASWIETWALATVVWAAAGSVAYAVWRSALPGLMGLIAAMACLWTLVFSDDQLLTIGVPIIVMSLSAHWLGRGDMSIFLLATSMAIDAGESALTHET